MKEVPEKHPEFDPETYTDPILEECYRIKAEISAQFETLDEYFAYVKARQEENKRDRKNMSLTMIRPNIQHPIRDTHPSKVTARIPPRDAPQSMSLKAHLRLWVATTP